MRFFILDFIFPKRCVGCGKLGEYLCKNCYQKIEFIDKSVCPICRRETIGGKTHSGCVTKFGPDGLVVVCKYRGLVSRTIKKIKYKWVYDLEEVLVDLMMKGIGEYDLPKNLILVPVPLHSNKRKLRGFNQSEILARDLGKRLKVPTFNLLLRSRETNAQVGLSNNDRKKNVQGAFTINNKFSARGKNVLLFDDVYTTGATMMECCSVLKSNGAKAVWACAIALG